MNSFYYCNEREGLFVSSRSGRSVGRPDGRKNALEIAAENQGDVFLGILAANQALGQVEDLLRIIDAVQIELLTRTYVGVAPFEIHVAADANVLHAY